MELRVPMLVPALKTPVSVSFTNGALSGQNVSTISRCIRDLAGIFSDDSARALLPPDRLVYQVQSYCPVAEGTSGGLFFGNTALEPGLVGNEYFMTKGHFHVKGDTAEFYWCLQGNGVLLLMDESRRCRGEQMCPGSLHYIPGLIAHRVVNTGTGQLRFGACWPADAGHDYHRIAKDGFAARVLRINGQPAIQEL